MLKYRLFRISLGRTKLKKVNSSEEFTSWLNACTTNSIINIFRVGFRSFHKKCVGVWGRSFLIDFIIDFKHYVLRKIFNEKSFSAV